MALTALHLLTVALVYAGLAAMAVGALCILKPLRIVRLGTRTRAFVAFAAGWVLAAAGMLIPAPLERVASPRTDLDRAMPEWQFHERHATTVDAAPDRVYRAIKETTADEILLFRTLTWIRRFGRPLPPNILNAPPDRPLLDIATSTSFVTLSDRPREIVVGTAVVAPSIRGVKGVPTAEEFLALRHQPGFALATMNFAIAPRGERSSLVTTETRVFATDPRTARRFASYWRVIYPGSALIRRMWLRAIARRAERS